VLRRSWVPQGSWVSGGDATIPAHPLFHGIRSRGVGDGSAPLLISFVLHARTAYPPPQPPRRAPPRLGLGLGGWQR